MTRDPASSNPRALAARVVAAVASERRYLDAALAAAFAGLAESAPRALVQELAYGTLRWYHQLDGIACLFLKRPLKARDADLHALLLGGLYQLRHQRIAAHAAVNETVAAADALGKPWGRALLNACLRAAQREAARVAAALAADDVLRLSHPAWLLAALRAAYPRDWEAIAAANNARPPFALRVNLARIGRDDYRARLAAAGLDARPSALADCGLVLAEPVAVGALPGFADGLVSVQDEAAQLAAIRLDARPGERVLDACAAPGGKTAHIAERTPGLARLVAVEQDAARAARIHDNLARLGLAAEVAVGDAAVPGGWWDGQPFDRILLDAPCSASGVIRRHPDVKLRRRPEDLPRLTAAQARLLDGVWPLLRPGGKLLYFTCSILPDENEQQLRAFLARHPDAAAAAPGEQRLPRPDGGDGFYYGTLAKHG